ncbi:MAG: hypothetical protein HFJ50_01590 [Clostridia bacterium]|nr:hypothetical protein [Clostridia bacterium]
MYSWGLNKDGALGSGTTVNSDVPRKDRNSRE